MKTVLITGANKGIGLETARQLAQLDYFVYLGSRDKANGDKAVGELNKLGITNIASLAIDVTNIDSIKKAKEELENKIDALDILINNAGISGEEPQNIATVDIENLKQIFETNFFGAIQITQQFIPLLQKSVSPNIINVSSGLGSLSRQSAASNNGAYSAYSSSKTALNAFTVLLAREFQNTNFKINSIAPGYTATDLNNFQGTQTVEEAANIIVKYATLDNSASGRFYENNGEVEW